MTTTKQAEIAQQFADAWTTDTRNDGVLFCKLRDGSPQWMTDAIHAAHGDIMPLDWIYEHCSRIVDMMTEYEPEQWDDSVSEWCDGLTDVYNIELAQWLALHLDFAEYVDNATQELGHSDRGIFGDIAMGQYSVLENIAYAMLNAVREQAEAAEIEE
jgi:hypothetical protein